MHGLMHGEKGNNTLTSHLFHCSHTPLPPAVAFGVVAQLILANAPTTELDRYISLMLSVNLPVTFAQLGIPNVTDEELRAVAKLSVAEGETIWNMESAISEDIVFGALRGANAASEDYIRRSGWKRDE